jgi:hypothetical protein
MSIAAIPFAPTLETSSEEIAGASSEAYNLIIDARGTLRRRPGIGAYTGVAPDTSIDANGVLGLYLTQAKVAHTSGTDDVSGTHPGVLYAVGATVNASGGGHNRGRNIYRVESGTATLLSGTTDEDRLTTPATIATTRYPRPIFAETEALLVIAGGAEIEKVDIRPETFSAPNFTTNADYQEASFLGGCPPLASHVFCNSSRLCANDTQLDQTKVRYSDISQGIVDFIGHETWSPSPGAAGFFTAEARSDNIVACAENTNDIFLFGTTSLQLFAPDGSSTFAPTVTQEAGCLAPYGIVKSDDRYVWLDHLTRIVSGDGHEWNDIGGAIQQTLDQLAAPSDAYAYRYSETFADCIIFRFETDAETFVLQPGVGWGRWGTGDPDLGTDELFPVLCHHLRSDGGLNVVGLEDGTIRVLSIEFESDLGDPIVAFARTGFIDRDSDKLKFSKAVYLTFKRSVADSLGASCFLEWRDVLADEWTSIEIDLGVGDGNMTPTVELRSLGIYRRRQWRLRWASEPGLYLVRASEEFDVLEN